MSSSKILSQAFKAESIIAALYRSGYPDSFILRQKSVRNSAFLFQGISGEQFLRIRSASCVRAALLTLPGMADLAKMSILVEFGFLKNSNWIFCSPSSSLNHTFRSKLGILPSSFPPGQSLVHWMIWLIELAILVISTTTVLT